MCVYVFVCVYVRARVRVRVRVRVRMRVRVRDCVCVRVHVRMRALVSVHVRACVCVRAPVFGDARRVYGRQAQGGPHAGQVHSCKLRRDRARTHYCFRSWCTFTEVRSRQLDPPL